MRMLRRAALSTSLIAVLLLAPTGAAAATGTFADDDGSTYEPAIEALAAEAVVEGCDDDGTRFCPDEPVRRDQAASLIARALELPPAADQPFDDLEGNVHADAVAQLAAAGITRGCTTGTFCPDDTLRRDQMASLLVRATEAPATSDRYFRDIGGVHAGAINALAAAGITAGCSTKGPRYCPGQHVLRGEMALFLARALELRPATALTPLPEPEPEPRPEPKPEARPAADTTVWDRLAACESGGNWSINTGNGYYGGLQFSLPTWRWVGGRGYPHQNSKAEQIKRGRILQARSGWGQWPACSRKLGLR